MVPVSILDALWLGKYWHRSSSTGLSCQPWRLPGDPRSNLWYGSSSRIVPSNCPPWLWVGWL